MPPKLYMTEMSPPVRGVMLTAEALGVQLEYVNINFLEKEHLKPAFIEMNPQHTVPTFQDGDFIVWDSHAIETYLVTVYGKDSTLLPKDPKKRAIVDQRLQFDAQLFERLRKSLAPIWLNSINYFPQEVIDEITEGYRWVEQFLEKTSWIAGDVMTVADFSLIATISTVNEFMPFDKTKFPKMENWIKRLEKLPYYEKMNARGARALGEVVNSKLAKS